MVTTRWSTAGIFLLVICGSDVSAQQIPGCTSAVVMDPPRTVFRCNGGLIIEAEAFAAFRNLQFAIRRADLHRTHESGDSD